MYNNYRYIIKTIEAALNINHSAAIIHRIQHPVLEEYKVDLLIKREDQLHPIISGNKWRKLKYTLADALTHKASHLISMGGAYSNHLHALAYIGHQLNIKTTGIIRGEAVENQTLNDLRTWNMQLVFIDRNEFRKLRNSRTHDCDLAKQYHGYWIPEGGYSPQALPGVREIIKDIHIDYDYITLACGTGATLAGLIQAVPEDKKIIGFSSFKGNHFLYNDVKQLIQQTLKTNWSINFDYHFGGFAKINKTLLSFINDFESITKIPIDPIYNGKMFYGLLDKIQHHKFKIGAKILAIHTGGIQGSRSIEQ